MRNMLGLQIPLKEVPRLPPIEAVWLRHCFPGPVACPRLLKRSRKGRRLLLLAAQVRAERPARLSQGAAVEMNIVELFFFLLGVVLTIVIWKFLFPYLGWWGILPAAILGFGSIMVFVMGVNRLLARYEPKGGEGPEQK